jgi:hypothetical protein
MAAAMLLMLLAAGCAVVPAPAAAAAAAGARRQLQGVLNLEAATSTSNGLPRRKLAQYGGGFGCEYWVGGSLYRHVCHSLTSGWSVHIHMTMHSLAYKTDTLLEACV